MDDWKVLVFLGVGVLIGVALAWKLQPSQPLFHTRVQPTFYENEDVYEWIDYTGKARKLVRHRKIKVVEE